MGGSLEKTLIGLAVAMCVFAGTALVLGRPEAPFMAFAITGRLHGGCSWRGALHAAEYERSRQAARADVARRSRLITRDGPLTLWQSPHGQAWIQDEQTEGWAAFGAGDLHHWPPRWAQLDVVPVVPVRAGSIVIDAGGHIGESANQALKMGGGPGGVD